MYAGMCPTTYQQQKSRIYNFTMQIKIWSLNQLTVPYLLSNESTTREKIRAEYNEMSICCAGI